MEGVIENPGAFLRTGHVFMLLSRYEGMPNALLEAMAAGLPCIATRVGEVPHVIQDGVNGLLIESDDVDAALSAIMRIFDDWEAAKRMGMAARRTCEQRFTTSAMVAGIERAIGDLLPSWNRLHSVVHR
jgi:glycosyltransferase involved in cell wall biosynthesis